MFFFPVGLSLVSQHSQQVFLGVEVCENNERPTGKKNTIIEWDDGGKIGNKNILILTEIFPSVHETWYLKVMTILFLLIL